LFKGLRPFVVGSVAVEALDLRLAWNERMESFGVLLEGVASVFEGMASTLWTTALSVVVVLPGLLGEFAE
jgi:hypothetical protein